MFCPNCGAQIPDNATVCGACAASVQTESYEPSSQLQECEQTAPYAQPQEYAEQPAVPQAPQYPMNWYNFLVKFAMIAGAVINIINGILYLTGLVYVQQENATMEEVKMFYSFYPSLQIVDILNGVGLLAIAALGFIGWKQLKNYEKAGPQTLYSIYVLNIALVVVYSVLGCVVLGTDFSLVAPNVVGSVIPQGVILFCNYKYFTKRKDLFVN